MEIWKDIAGYVGIYQVSNTGVVKALQRTITNKNGKPQRYPEKLLKPDAHVTTNTAYNRVTLSKDNSTNRYCVHQLVATAFITNPEIKPHVNHIDNDGLNNNVSNLEWCTHSENMLHAQRQGRLFTAQSKGGKAGSQQEVLRAISNCTSMIGNTYGYWEVLAYLGKEGAGKGKHYVMCKCLCCGITTQRVQATRLTRGETSNCRSCGQDKRKI